jgi:acyl carrier protein
MTSSSIANRVIRIVSRAAMVPERGVKPATPLASLGIGSLEQIECVLAVEEEFQVELDQPELWQTRTVQDVIDAVTRATSAGKPPRP